MRLIMHFSKCRLSKVRFNGLQKSRIFLFLLFLRLLDPSYPPHLTAGSYCLRDGICLLMEKRVQFTLASLCSASCVSILKAMSYPFENMST